MMWSSSSCSVASSVAARRREEEGDDDDDDGDDDDAVTGVSRPNSAAVERSDSLMEREKREGGCELRVSDLSEDHSLMKTVW